MNDTSLIDPKVLEWNKKTAKKINEMFRNMSDEEFVKMMSDANDEATRVSSEYMEGIDRKKQEMNNKNGHLRYI